MRWATLLLLAGWGAGWVAENRTTRISVLPRRGGAILWVAPAWMGSEWLFDPGDARTVERVTLPFLRSEGVNRVAHLVLGRGGVETLGGALDLEQRLWVGDHFFPDIPIRSPYLRRWRESLQRTRRRLLPLVRGNVAGPWEVLHPGRGEAPGPAGEDSPLVMRGEFNGVRVLWVPPLGIRGQDTLLRQAGREGLRADLLLAGVSSSSEALSDPFLEAVSPRVILLLEASLPAASRAGPGLKRRVGGRGCPVWSVREWGTLSLELTGGRIRVHPWSKLRPPRPASEESPPADIPAVPASDPPVPLILP